MAKINKLKIARNIKKLRTALGGVTQVELAKLLKTTQGAISGYERGEYTPKATTVFWITQLVDEHNLNFKTEDFIR